METTDIGKNAGVQRGRGVAKAASLAGAAIFGATGATIADNVFDTVDLEDRSEEPIEEITSNEAAASATSAVSASEPTPITDEEGTVSSDEVIIDVNPDDNPEAVNPDEIADAIIAEVRIDSGDIDAEEIIEFDEIGTLYLDNGESYVAAAAHSSVYGDDLYVVDVDGDLVFDVIIDEEGYVLDYVHDYLSVSDAEMMIDSDPGYLAANDNDNTSLPVGEDISNDIISA